MKRILILALAATATLAMVGTDSTEARRLGGGRSLGTQRQATPTLPAAPNIAPSGPAAMAPAVAPRAAASGASRWLGPLAGLAAGLGLAALLSHFGLSEGFASILILVLLVFGGLILIRMFRGRREGTRAPLQYAGAGPAPDATSSLPQPSLPSAPLDRTNRLDPVFGRTAVPGNAPASGKFPPGFDPVPFVQQAKLQFRKLQAAYDSGDRSALADVMTPEMYAEIDREIAERGTHVPTEVATLDATILEVTTEGDRHWAGVQFTGTLREDGAMLPKPFEEIWNLVKPVDGKSGWLLAGIRQLA